MTAKRVYRGRIVELDEEEVRLPNGVTTRLEIVRHPGGAGVVAVDDGQRVRMLRQYRHAVGEWLWEIPAGRLDPGESPGQAARRELAEEAGLAASHWRSLGEVISSPGVFTERVHLFLATGLAPASGAVSHGADEVFELAWLQLGDALAWAQDGRIRDAKTAIALFRAAAALASSA